MNLERGIAAVGRLNACLTEDVKVECVVFLLKNGLSTLRYTKDKFLFVLQTRQMYYHATPTMPVPSSMSIAMETNG